MPLRLTIEDTGVGLKIECDEGYPGVRLWKVLDHPSGKECYLATRSIFFNPQDEAAIAEHAPALIQNYFLFTEDLNKSLTSIGDLIKMAKASP
ncbi:MAG: hypothetical protein WBH00_09065 [Xanthobacteraceae bacterium]